MKSVIIDNNVLVSAFIGSKNCSEIYKLLKQDKFLLIISDSLLNELAKVLERSYVGLSKDEIKEVIEHILVKSQKVFPVEKIYLCRDPKDNIVLECATVTKVDFIVTGDKDLLEIKSFNNISIITPRKFLSYYYE